MSISAKDRLFSFLSLTALVLPCLLFSGIATAQESQASYRLTQPSVGLFQITEPVTLSIEKNGATAAIKGNEIAPGMSVVLYDDYNFPLAATGRVESVEGHLARITWPDGLPQKPSARARVVLYEDIMAKRLPRSVLDGRIIWKAVPSGPDQYRVEQITLPDTLKQNEYYFDVDNAVRADEFVVIAPDRRLTGGTVITQPVIIASDAPATRPQERAVQIAKDMEMMAMLAALQYTGPALDDAAMDAAGSAATCPFDETAGAAAQEDDAAGSACGTCPTP